MLDVLFTIWWMGFVLFTPANLLSMYWEMPREEWSDTLAMTVAGLFLGLIWPWAITLWVLQKLSH